MTVLTATPQAGSAFTPPRVLLAVTGAPSPPAGGYTGNFSASADSWTTSGTGASATLWTAGDVSLTLQSTLTTGTVGNVITASRVVTGLTIGAVYKLRVTVTRSSPNAGSTRVRVTGSTTGSYVAVPVGAQTVLEVTFTATATSHTINVDQQRAVTFEVERVYIVAATVAPTGTWQGTTIRRTDVNGSSVVVREDQGGMDTAAGTMTLYDYEAALLGPIGYAVTDGNGVVTYAGATFSTGARINLLPNPSLEAGITGWTNSGTGTTSTVTTGGESGTMRLRIVTGTGASSGASIIVPGVTVGTRYGARLRAQAGAASDFRITMQWLDAASAVLSSPSSDFLGVASGSWVTAYTESTAPAGAVSVRVYLQRVNSSTSGVVVNVDAALVRSLAVGEVFNPAEYIDGSLAATATTLYGWLGTPHLSPSMATDRAESTAGVWITTPAAGVPSTGVVAALPLTLMLTYDETSESNGSLHKIIGRADPIANPGPLSLRAGTLELYCADYLTAKAIRTLLAAGEVAQVRQPTHPGLDLYFVAREVRITPATEDTDPLRWVATLSYAEVLAA